VGSMDLVHLSGGLLVKTNAIPAYLSYLEWILKIKINPTVLKDISVIIFAHFCLLCLYVFFCSSQFKYRIISVELFCACCWSVYNWVTFTFIREYEDVNMKISNKTKDKWDKL
jgi:hypothetical protein